MLTASTVQRLNFVWRRLAFEAKQRAPNGIESDIFLRSVLHVPPAISISRLRQIEVARLSSPENIAAHNFFLGIALQYEGQLEQARQLFDFAKEQHWLAPLATIGLITCDFMQVGENEVIAERYGYIPEENLAGILQARILRMSGDKESALTRINHCINKDPSDYNALVEKGNILDVPETRQMAFDCYDAAIAVDGSAPDAFLERGIAFSEAGKKDSATEDFRRAVGLDPNCSYAWAMWAWYDIDAKNFSAAKEKCERALAASPNHHLALGYLGEAKRGEGNAFAAITDFDRALEAKPGWNWALRSKARALSDSRRFGEATKICDAIIHSDPKDTEAYCVRGDALREEGKFDLAISDYSAAIQLHENPSSNTFYWRGKCLYEIGNFALAAKDLGEAISNGDNGSYTLRLRAQCYEKLNKIEEACEDYEAAEAQDGDGLAALNMFAMLVGRDQRSRALRHLETVRGKFGRLYRFKDGTVVNLDNLERETKRDRKLLDFLFG
jgi:tetratricopeptide (TPR) repeat protein